MIKNKFIRILSMVIVIIALTSYNQLKKAENTYGTTKEVINNSLNKDLKVSSKDSDEKLADLLNKYKNFNMSNSKFEKGYYDYHGTINNNLLIQMSIYPLPNEIVGSYFYEKHGKEVKLKGKAEGKDIILYEYDQSGKNTGIFKGTMDTVDKIQGTWISGNGKISYPFSLSLKSILPGSQYGKRYAVAVGETSDEDVEKFANKIQGYIINNNKEKLAEEMSYPISVKINGKNTKIQNKAEFIKNYDLIFNPSYKQAMTNAPAKYMFANYKGIMFGEGQYNMWINEIASNNGTSKLMVTAVNN
ncbi:hypothetical protein JOC70_000195 [Clostridium pascui]|uniref:hypothetical protein n=1 Tax=Clostridium pascui TaxID=46609 RepID=UPI00195EBF1B|nr:hypothetical protein [Clostridium pascui]MBM7868726.1 hypothetical protein [Clostridium pascui]